LWPGSAQLEVWVGHEKRKLFWPSPAPASEKIAYRVVVDIGYDGTMDQMKDSNTALSEGEQGFSYVGSELDLFAAVHNWKSYWSSRIKPHIRGSVLEVGAGIGSNFPFLQSPAATSWCCLEPDGSLVSILEQNLADAGNPNAAAVVHGKLSDLDPARTFDSIVYIDVLEHIEDDRGELASAAAHLNPGGSIIVLSPAHQALYTPFDKAIGHFRRYNKQTLRAVSPAGLRLVILNYIDSAGLLLSTANRLFLRSSMPTKQQLALWDRRIIPISRFLDPCLQFSAGKSIIAVWEKLPYASQR
jgi:SAM-dependent methyltransferase